MIEYWLKMLVIVVINLTIHPPLVTFLSPKLRFFWPAPWIKSSGWGQNRRSHKNKLSAFCAALEIWKKTWVTVTICYTNGRLPVFSLNLSSAGKGSFMAGKAKNIFQRCTFLGGRGAVEWGTWFQTCCEILDLLRPTGILRKSAIIFRQQFKTFDSNNFTLSSTLSFHNVWPIKRKAVYILVHFHISIYYLDEIDCNLQIFQNNLFNLSKSSSSWGGKNCCLKQ